MEFWAVLIMFICLCVDNMVMANMSAMKSQNNNVRSSLSLRIALTFSIFHALFLLAGYLIAYIWPAQYSWTASVWISFAFVMLIGIRLLLETVEKSPSFGIDDPEMNPKLIKTGMLLALNSAMLGFALQIMSVNYSLVWPLFALFAVSMIMSLLGFLFGRPDSKRISSKVVESVAGIVMIVLAIRILIMYR
ncbi:putative Mn2+ efflux pump MntP [Elusimicrobium simillimum]|uniref:manganese efflux pump MntP n=1 Tax=Elusimicrobium simillimum TaxID=3143438 RepID=UPI003C703EA9